MPALAVSYAGLLGGAERVLLAIATGLPEPPLIACPPGPLAEAAREAGLGVFELRERSLELRRSPRDRIAMPLRVAGQAAEVRALVRGQAPSCVLAWGMRAALAVALAYPRGADPPVLFEHVDLLPGPLIARAVRTAAARADLVVTCSRCLAADLDPTGALGARLRVVPLGVDLQHFRPDPEQPPARADRPERQDSAPAPREEGAGALDRWAQPQEDGRDVLLLGAIEGWKRPDLALEAVALAGRAVPDVRLRVLGAPIGDDGERLLADLHTRAQRPDLVGRVELAGPVPDPRVALRDAACLLHCSEREPYGMVVAEALASGLPVVVPDSCGPAEIADASCGRLYAPGDPVAAAAALIEVLQGDAAAMRAAARTRAEAHLDLEDTRRAYAGLIEELAGQARDAAARATRSQVGTPAAARVTAARSTRTRTGTADAARGARIAVVTVIHDSGAHLRGLLDSLALHLPAAQVVVVDSGSSDGGLALARDSGADVLALGANLGFGRGVNAGLELVGRPVTALLNPDVELLDASLEAAAAEAAAHPDRLLAPLVLLPDGRRQDTAQREPGSPLLALHALVPGAALGPLAAMVEPWRGLAPRRVGWAVGCALLGATDALRALGPFDERVFMYGEDLDLGLRASDAEIETWFWPAARVLHHGAHASEAAFGGEPFELLARRRRAVIRERRGSLRAAADDLLQAATFVDRAVLKTLARRDASRERRQLQALAAARRGAAGERPS